MSIYHIVDPICLMEDGYIFVPPSSSGVWQHLHLIVQYPLGVEDEVEQFKEAAHVLLMHGVTAWTATFAGGSGRQIGLSGTIPQRIGKRLGGHTGLFLDCSWGDSTCHLLGGSWWDHISLYRRGCWRDHSGLFVGGSAGFIFRFILGQTHQKLSNTTPIMFLSYSLCWSVWLWMHYALIRWCRWNRYSIIGGWLWWWDDMKSVGSIAVTHARVITKWHNLPTVPFQTHSVVVNSFFQWTVDVFNLLFSLLQLSRSIQLVGFQLLV